MPHHDTADPKNITTNFIRQLGISEKLKGYHYLREAILLSINDTQMLESVTKDLYPTVAKKFNTTYSRVERAIRYAIETAWEKGDFNEQNAFFGYTIDDEKGKTDQQRVYCIGS
ncbi:MAG: sporulation initiation factor Spo0A C-terminal domain-containing protein [Ruminococcus sp.]|nr:sporulation initiation factor Spo0A C-terminal domain-containing protein [Ruminococcus sp.]